MRPHKLAVERFFGRTVRQHLLAGEVLSEDFTHDFIITFAIHGAFNFGRIQTELRQIKAPGQSMDGVGMNDHSVQIEYQRQSGRHVRGRIHFERIITYRTYRVRKRLYAPPRYNLRWMDIYEELARLRRAGQVCALATIVDVRGSIPSYQTAKLLVRADGSMVGTIGGGCLEAEVYSAAREVIRTGQPKRLSFTLNQDAAGDNGLICGGQLEVFIEPVAPLPRAFIFGAGHVSKSLSAVATLAGFEAVVLDDREAFANRERFPEAAEVIAGPYEEIFPRLTVHDSSYILIVTRGHRDDLRVLRWAVTTPARYIAMIGSRRKVIELKKVLEKEGAPMAQPDRMFAPMGLDIGAVTPEEIAVAVVAEMIAVRRQAGSPWRALSKSLWGSARSAG